MTTPHKDLTLGAFPFSQLPLYTPHHTPHNYCSEPPPPAPLPTYKKENNMLSPPKSVLLLIMLFRVDEMFEPVDKRAN